MYIQHCDMNRRKGTHYDKKTEESIDSHYCIRCIGAGIQPDSGEKFLYKIGAVYDTVSGHRV